jgi:hypothetical protein
MVRNIGGRVGIQYLTISICLTLNTSQKFQKLQEHGRQRRGDWCRSSR